MAQTHKTIAQLISELPDNTTRLLSPTDMRDLVVSLSPFTSARDPNNNDDGFNSGGTGAFFSTGQLWWNQAFSKLWYCVLGTLSAAEWIQMVLAGPGGDSRIVASVLYDQTAAILNSKNIASVVKNAVGDYTVTTTLAFNSNYASPLVNEFDSGATLFFNHKVTNFGGSPVFTRVLFFDNLGLPADPTEFTLSIVDNT